MIILFREPSNPWDDVVPLCDETPPSPGHDPSEPDLARIAELHRDRRVKAEAWIASRDALVRRVLGDAS